jgi:hypothetical protein
MKSNNLIRYLTLIFVFCLIIIEGCSYSFTGASVPSHIKTIAIPIVQDRSGSGEADLSDNFTNELIQFFLDDNTLQVTEKTRADAVLECTILSLSDAPSMISGNENVTTRRITIQVRAIYKDLVKRKTTFDRNLSNFSDYKSSENAVANRIDAINAAIDKLSEDILLAVVSNW